MECRELDRLIYAIHAQEQQLITECLFNFQTYGKKMTKANDTQVGGDHYKSKAIQPWDYVAANDIGYFEGNVIKYVSRWKDKNGIEDLIKAKHFLEKLIEIQKDDLK